MTQRLEAALALGFSSPAEMDNHQAWLTKLRNHGNLARCAVAESEKTGIVDTRPAFAVWDAR